MKKTSIIAILCIALSSLSCGRGEEGLRLLYWNIQNGMWADQENDYKTFTDWVKGQKPDICVWCEAQPIYKDGTHDNLDNLKEWRADSLLNCMWTRLGKRYGHKYVFIGGHRDNFPQVITSRYPLEAVDRITGNGRDSIVSHGAGWARLRVAGQRINVVTLHTWPQKYGFNIAKEDRERSKAAAEGDLFRRMEMEYICKSTILKDSSGLWMMMGDFNSKSRKDNWVYNYPDDDTRLLVHDYILGNTPYIDIINEDNRNNFITSTYGRERIDYVYCNPALAEKVQRCAIVTDDYTRPVRSQKYNRFCEPSDHRPIIVDFKL